MTDRAFLDTNIFVYLYDSDSPGKQAKARALVERPDRERGERSDPPLR